METNLDEQVSIQLSKGELLVILDFLGRSFEVWKASGDQEVATFALSKPDAGERTALWHLECVIEKALVEVLADNYVELIRLAKNTLTSE